MISSMNPMYVCVITGATGMLGRAAAIDLAARGAHVTLVSRDPVRGARVLDEVRTAGPDGEHTLIVGNLSEPNSVRAIATQIRDRSDEIHALIHAAAIFTRQRQENSTGYELMFATNVLGRFLLTFELARRLAGTGVTSNAYHPGVLQSNRMREMPTIVRWMTLPFGRRADKVAHALGALALDDRYAQETGRFYNFEKPINPHRIRKTYMPGRGSGRSAPG